MVKKKLERSKGKYYSGHEVKLKGVLVCPGSRRSKEASAIGGS